MKEASQECSLSQCTEASVTLEVLRQQGYECGEGLVNGRLKFRKVGGENDLVRPGLASLLCKACLFGSFRFVEHFVLHFGVSGVPSLQSFAFCSLCTCTTCRNRVRLLLIGVVSFFATEHFWKNMPKLRFGFLLSSDGVRRTGTGDGCLSSS